MKKIFILLIFVISLFGDEFEDFDSELSTKKVSDPLSSYNRVMTDFNDGLYINVLQPVSNGYIAITHKEVRKSVDRFFENLYFPKRCINNLLQGKFSFALEETGRFLINSTIGILGLFDPAKSEFGLESHNEDFGQTLGFYGVGSGPHIVLPLFGPSNLRDMLSMYPDVIVSPIDSSVGTERKDYTLSTTYLEYMAIRSLQIINKTSLNMDKYDKMRDDAVDLYPYLRDIYEQRRAKEIGE